MEIITEGDIKYQTTEMGNHTMIGIQYMGELNPVDEIDLFIEQNFSKEKYWEFVERKGVNLNIRFILIKKS